MSDKDCTTCRYDGTINNSCIPCDGNFSEWKSIVEVEEEMEITRYTAFELIDKERNRQDVKWGEQSHPPEKWTSILGEEFGEYCQAVNETVFDNADKKHMGGYENMLKELTHVAAVAVGAMECLMRNKKDINKGKDSKEEEKN